MQQGTLQIHNASKKQLLVDLHRALSPLCASEACWIDLPFVDMLSSQLREKVKYFTFKPPAPESKYAWLSTTDINDVMQQYRELFPQFHFVGALPSDFYRVTKFHYSEIPEYHKVGFVFNLDTHDQKGSHWVAGLIDNVSKTIEYFDSAGNPPNKHIHKFLEILQAKTEHKILVNRIVHQRENSECGIYSIHFLIKRLLGFTFHDISKSRVSDADMNKFRDSLFRNQSD